MLGSDPASRLNVRLTRIPAPALKLDQYTRGAVLEPTRREVEASPIRACEEGLSLRPEQVGERFEQLRKTILGWQA